MADPPVLRRLDSWHRTALAAVWLRRMRASRRGRWSVGGRACLSQRARRSARGQGRATPFHVVTRNASNGRREPFTQRYIVSAKPLANRPREPWPGLSLVLIHVAVCRTEEGVAVLAG